MKKNRSLIKQVIIVLMMVMPLGGTLAQGTGKASIAVLNIESKGVIPDAESVGNLIRLELEKTEKFNLLDMYDVADILKKNNIDISTCLGKSCVIAAGKVLNADKMITGNVNRMGEKIAITLKVIDVKNGEIEKSNTEEYLNLQQEIQKMIEISVRRLAGVEPDENLVKLLISYNQPIESPETQLLLSGPRMGASITAGQTGNRLMESKDNGGFDMYPITFQIGWQHEVQYLSSGNFQGLFEFIGLIGGLESGKFIPSVTVLNGFRMGKQGWEFGFGPSFRIVSKADGYYENDKWHLASDWVAWDSNAYVANPHPIVSRLDSRGDLQMSIGLILAVGRTFKSGYLNIPVNVYISPRKEGWIYGLSFGFNIHRKPKVE